MKIKKLIMHNFGVYASTNILELKGDNPIVLIGGMNGRGKTTILEAILLGLYGSNSFAYMESKYTTYGQYLKSYINKADGTLETYVEIEFSMDAADDEVYCVRRDWTGKGQRVKEKIVVKKNGKENSFLTGNWTMFVENILPSALSNFFFFDGEKISELAVEDTSERMKESIKEMLGITVLDVLQGDIGKLISKISKNSEDKQDLQKLEEYRAKKDNAETALNEIDVAIINANKELEQLQFDLEKLNVEYSVKGGGILKQKNQLIKQRSESLAIIASSQEQLLELVAGEMPLILVADLLKDILEKSKAEQEQRINSMAFEKICASYEKFNMKSKVINGFIDYMKSEIGTSGGDELYGLSDLSLYQVEALNNSGLKQSVEKAKELFRKRNVHQKEVEDIDNSLSVDVDEKLLSELFGDIREKEYEIITKKVEIENLEKERTTLHGTLIAAESEFSKFAENLLSVLESVDVNERTVKYAHMAIEIIKLYRIRLQERKTEVLAQTMTECYKKLANKKNHIDYIKMDPETLDLHYI